MKRFFNILGVLIFFGVFILGFYYFSNGKSITKATEWAKGKIPLPTDGEYDVIVVGSDPEGISAALGASRSGAKTILLGKEDGLGGLLTYGMLNTLDMNRNEHGVILTRGVFQEFYNSIGRTESFDVENVKNIFKEMIANEKNLEYRPNYKFEGTILEDNIIKGVKMLDSNGNKIEIKGKRVIDATQDGDVCVSAGVPYYVGMEDMNATGNMSATLVLKVGGVNWKDIEIDVDRYKRETHSKNCGFNKSTAWGFGKWCYDKYTPIHENMQLRGPNFGLQKDGTILINALQIFDVDGLSEESKKLAMEQGKEEAKNVVEHFRKTLKSFKDAYLVDVADELYIRETRHIKGEYLLKASDLLGNKNFKDKIAVASYPIDIQATAKSNTGIIIGVPNQYTIPLRCVVPKKIDNLFIVGRSASYSSVAAGSARVVPTGMAVGESTGIAAVYTIYKDTTPRELTKDKSRVKQLVGILKNQNIYLPEYVGRDPNENVQGYDKIKKIIDLGMLSGDYTNNFLFDKEATASTLCNLMLNGLQKGGNEKYDLNAMDRIKRGYSKEKLTGGGAARILAIFFDDYKEPPKVQRNLNWTDEQYEAKKQERVKKIEKDCWKIAKDKKYFSESFRMDDILTYRQTCVIVVDNLEKYIGRELGNPEYM